jgi:autotransporter-associated beta strand protein
VAGYYGVTALSNGNYVVRSPYWNGGRGAVTWVSGTAGATGFVSSVTSLTGSNANDYVGSYGTALSNGNYVVASPYWNGNRGAATWGSGTAGVTGTVSAANSLTGSNAGDRVGTSVTALSNGNYVVASPTWSGSLGAATWGSGTAGVTGTISAANSLVGSSANDSVGNGGITALSNGNYVVASPGWRGQSGAATWGSGTAGVTGTISAANSLIGSSQFELTGLAVTALSNGNYVVAGPHWNLDRGAATWVSGTSGRTLDGSSTISPQNSLLGLTASAGLGAIRDDPAQQTFVAAFSSDGTGRVLVGFPNPNLLTFARAQGLTVTITPALLTATLNAGGAVVLQATNDITVNSPITVSAGGSGGALTLQAGHSILINASITTDNGNLTLFANDQLGITRPDFGAAVITMAPGTTLNTGTGALTVQLRDGGSMSRASSSISLEAVTAGTVTVTNNGLTAGSDVWVGPVTSSGGQTYANPNGTTLVLSGGLSAAAAITFQNSVNLISGTAIAPTVNFAGSGTQILSTFGLSLPNLVHNGSGILLLTSPLTVSGTLTNTQGLFDANGQAVTALGPATVSGGLYIASSAAQRFSGGLTLSGTGTFLGQTGAVTVGGDFTQTGGTIIAPSANLSVAGNLAISGGVFNADGGTFTFNGAGDQTLTSGRQLFANLAHAGSGTLRLSGSDLTVTGTFTNSAGNFDANGQAVSVSGLTTIANGTQYLGSTGSQYFGGGLNMLAGGSLDGGNLTLAGDLSAGQDGPGNPATITGNLSLDGATRTVTVAAGGDPVQLLISAVLSGSPGVGLTKAGAGTLRLLGNNTYTGTTTVLAGLLIVDGNQSGSNVVLNGGSLGGQGTVGGVTATGGTLSPGDPEATGILTSLGDVGLASSETFSVRLNDITAGTGYDQLNVTGAVNLDSDAGAGSTLAVSVGFASQVGDTFTILTAGGGITGTFQGLAEGTTFTVNGMNFQITYQAAGGTAVVLTHVA